jgi:hypothetical protein
MKNNINLELDRAGKLDDLEAKTGIQFLLKIN